MAPPTDFDPELLESLIERLSKEPELDERRIKIIDPKTGLVVGIFSTQQMIEEIKQQTEWGVRYYQAYERLYNCAKDENEG